MSNKIKGVNVLICGSQKFEAAEFVFNALETFFVQTNGNIRKVFTSRFAGSCEFARQWVELKNKYLPDEQKIQIVDYMFDSFLEKKNNSLYDQMDFPDHAVQNSDFFQEGKELLISKGVNLVMAFPNQEGILGVATKNIAKAAQLAEIRLFDCSLLLQKLNNYQQEQKQETQVVEQEAEKPSLGFKNRHPNPHKR